MWYNQRFITDRRSPVLTLWWCTIIYNLKLISQYDNSYLESWKSTLEKFNYILKKTGWVIGNRLKKFHLLHPKAQYLIKSGCFWGHTVKTIGNLYLYILIPPNCSYFLFEPINCLYKKQTRAFRIIYFNMGCSSLKFPHKMNLHVYHLFTQ